MKIIKHLPFVFVLMISFCAFAQKSKSSKSAEFTPKPKKQVSKIQADPARDEKKVREMISLLSYMLNLLGNSTTTARDKDVLITESYSKIFRDSKVQVEDDLVEDRSVVTNKDIVAYLKDISFFFKEIKFEFDIDKIESGVNADNHPFYKVSLHRSISAITKDGKSVTNVMPRFIEINFNQTDQDLKIVSIYTNQLDEKEALLSWWKELSAEWQSVFKSRLSLVDSVSFNNIKRITQIEKLDISGNKFIQSFDPLSQLKNIKSLNLSQTNINDLSPIRNLGELTELNLSKTKVQDLSPLKYSTKLINLNISENDINDISVIQRMLKLQRLDLSMTRISDFQSLSQLSELIFLNARETAFNNLSLVQANTQMQELNIAMTHVNDLSPLRSLTNLEIIDCDSTTTQNFRALANIEKLKLLYANSTLLADLQPFQKLNHLEKIYCDQTAIKKNIAEAFMLAHPKVSVIYNSRDIKIWWDNLSDAWKEVIKKSTKISADPSSEELTRIGNLDSINFNNDKDINSLEPLLKFQQLKTIIANGTSIQDLSPLKDHKALRYIDLSNTNVTDLSILSSLTNLEIVKASNCKIVDIEPLQKMKSLKKLFVDATTINDINAVEFLKGNQKCLLIYKSTHLIRWWQNLSENWKEIFLTKLADTTTESFHRLVEQENFEFKDSPVRDLSGLSEFIRLNELHFSGAAISEIILSENLKSLKSLQASNIPIQNIEFVNQLPELEELDISNTAVEDIYPIWNLKKLKTLNCAGTHVKHLDSIEKLENLETLDCSNTNVNKLTSLDYLHLKSLKCYNTKVSNRSIQNFIASHADCKVVYYR